MSLLSKYRNRIEIIADILNIVKEGARKTQIMYQGNLSYKLLTRYLGEVIGSGLVCVGKRARIYQLTRKGEAFLEHFESYSKTRAEVAEHLNSMKGQMATLEKLCKFGRVDGNAELSDKSRRNSE